MTVVVLFQRYLDGIKKILRRGSGLNQPDVHLWTRFDTVGVIRSGTVTN